MKRGRHAPNLDRQSFGFQIRRHRQSSHGHLDEWIDGNSDASGDTERLSLQGARHAAAGSRDLSLACDTDHPPLQAVPLSLRRGGLFLRPRAARPAGRQNCSNETVKCREVRSAQGHQSRSGASTANSPSPSRQREALFPEITIPSAADTDANPQRQIREIRASKSLSRHPIQSMLQVNPAVRLIMRSVRK